MTSDEGGGGDPPAARTTRWLWLAAFALVAVPAVAGFALIDRNSGDGDGMGGSGGASTGVLPFSDIQTSDVSFEFEPEGDAAVLRVTTSSDAVCAVAYGETTGLGSIATDTDMAGGGHSDHHPVLTGLEPGKEYFFRLQAIDANGRLYASEIATFRVPGSPGTGADNPPGIDLTATATIADVSSEYSETFRAANAIDGSGVTEWSSRGDGDDAFITVDLGQDADVTGVTFRTRSMSDGTATITSFTMTVDGGATFGPYTAELGRTVVLVEFTGRLVRFDAATTTGGNTGAVEIEIFGEPADGSTLGALDAVPAATSELAATGREVFQRRCAACHGVDARGGTTVVGPDIVGQTVERIQYMIDNSDRMSGVDLTPSDLRAVEAYLSSDEVAGA